MTWFRTFLPAAPYRFHVARPALPPAARAPRLLRFPPTQPIGRVLTRLWGGPASDDLEDTSWTFLAPAQGEIVVPAGHEVELVLNLRGGLDLAPLASLPSDAIQRLTFGFYRGAEQYLVDDAQLQHLEHLTELYDLQFWRVMMTPRGLHALARMPGIQRLWLMGRTESDLISGADLAILRDLPQLVELHLNDWPFGDLGVGALPHLRALLISDGKFARAEGLTDLCALHPTLEALKIHGDWASTRDLADLATLTQLKALWLSTPTQLTETALVQLSQLSQLRTLRLGWHIATLAPLRALPKLEGLEWFNRVALYIPSRQVQSLAIHPFDEIELAPPGLLDDALADLADFPALRSMKLDLDLPLTHASLAGIARRSRLTWLDLSEQALLPQALVGLETLTTLRDLDLGETATDDAGLTALAAISGLERLRCYDTLVSDAGLAQLAGMSSLRTLNLAYTQVTNASMATIGTLTNLEELWLTQAPLDRAGIQYLRHLECLRTLAIACASEVTADDLHVLTGLWQLETLIIYNPPPGGIVPLGSIPSLISLVLNRDLVEPAGSLETFERPEYVVEVADIQALEHLPALLALDLNAMTLSDAAWAALGQLTTLHELKLPGSNISDRHLAHLARLPQLRTLNLDRTACSDTGMAYLAHMPQLEELSLQQTQVTPQSLPLLASLQRLDELSVSSPTVGTAEKEALSALLLNVRIS
jgi:internalin A